LEFIGQSKQSRHPTRDIDFGMANTKKIIGTGYAIWVACLKTEMHQHLSAMGWCRSEDAGNQNIPHNDFYDNIILTKGDKL
jgi:hypothetical protein